MMISEKSVGILKNFAKINSGMVIQPGKIQKTISHEKNIFVEAEFDEDFPNQFGIYDLNLFLANLTSFKNVDLDFAEDCVIMSDNGLSLTYCPCQPELVIVPPNKKLSIENPTATIGLPDSALSRVLNMASLNELPNISIYNKGNSLLLKAHDRSNSSSNIVEMSLGNYSGEDFVATYKTEHLKILPDDYVVDVKISPQHSFTRLKSTSKNITYFISLETK